MQCVVDGKEQGEASQGVASSKKNHQRTYRHGGHGTIIV